MLAQGIPSVCKPLKASPRRTYLVFYLSRDNLDFLEDELQFALECGASQNGGRRAVQVRRRSLLSELRGTADLDARWCDLRYGQ